MTFRKHLACGAAFIALTSTDYALAQDIVTTGTDTDTSMPAADDETRELDTIVVNARRHDEDLQKVPVAVAVLSPDDLKAKAVSNAYDLATFVPGLTTQASSGSSSQPAFAIRGRGTEYGAAAGSVETYFAEVPLSGHQQMPAFPAQFFDLQSVQVLKGPQGTLFGRSTTGGAVLFVPQAPTDEYGGYGFAQIGDYGNLKIEGAINIPLAGDKAILRLAGMMWDRDGYSKTLGGTTSFYTGQAIPVQRFDTQDVNEGRATLLLRPAEGLENSLIVAYHSDKNRNSSVNDLLRVGSGAIPDPTYTAFGPRRALGGVDLNRPASDMWFVANTTTYEISENLTFKNILSYISAEGYTRTPNDSDGTANPVIDIMLLPGQYPAKSEQFINELQVQGDNFLDGRMSWILGGSVDTVSEPDLSYISNVGQFVPGTGLVVDTTITSVNSDSYALFGSISYDISDRLKVTTGLRSTWYEVETDAYEQIVPVTGAPLPQTPIATALHANPTSDFQGYSGDISLIYDVNADTMVYAGYRRGWKPGGDNIKAAPGDENFDAETVDNFSIGLKSVFRLGDAPVRFNIEAYHDVYHDAQRSTLTVIPSLGALATVVYNTDEVTYDGIDLDFSSKLSSWLDVSGSYAYADAENTNWQNTPYQGLPGQTTDPLNANPVPFLSDHKVTLSARLNRELPGGNGELAFATTYSYQTESYISADSQILSNSAVAIFGPYCNRCVGGGTIGEYSLLNLRAEWNNVMGTNLNLAANANNVTDEVYSVGGSEVLHAFSNPTAFGPPRMFTLEALVRF